MLSDLLALQERELDARLAECMGFRWYRPSWGDGIRVLAEERHVKEWRLVPCDTSVNLADDWDRFLPCYSDPRSPRSLLEYVEAEIRKRGRSDEYTSAIIELREGEMCESGCAECVEWLLATAPTKVRCAAAVAVMEPHV
jgi:hypothetical protein